MKKDNKKEDLLLGLNKKIDRRDFLNSSLLGAGSVLYSMSAPSTLSLKMTISVYLIKLAIIGMDMEESVTLNLHMATRLKFCGVLMR